MARFLAVLIGAGVGFAVVWFAVVQPRQAARHAGGAPGAGGQAISATESAPNPSGSNAAKGAASAPLSPADLAAAIADLTADDDVVRGSAIEAWSARPDGSSNGPRRIENQADLIAALRDRLATMPEERLTVYVEAWGADDWWMKNFAKAHGRYCIFRAKFDDNIWVPYAFDQLDRFDPTTDLDTIRGLIDVFIDSKVANVRHHALECAAHYLGTECRPYALAHLRDPDNRTARTAWILAAKTGDIDASGWDWHGPRFVSLAVLYGLAVHHPDLANEACDRIEQDPVISKWFSEDIPLIRARASGKTDRETIVLINEGAGPGRVFEEAIRADELLTGQFPQYVQE